MKKIKILIFTLVMMVLVSCNGENSLADKAIEQGKLALANKDYDKALSSFELAADEGSKDGEVVKLIDIIKSYKQSLSLFEKNELESAKEAIFNIKHDYSKYPISEDIEALKKSIETAMKKSDNTWTIDEAVKLYEEVFKDDISWENYRSDLWSVLEEETYDNVMTLHFSNISGAGGSYSQFIKHDDTIEIISFDGNASFPNDPYAKYTVRKSDHKIVNTEENPNEPKTETNKSPNSTKINRKNEFLQRTTSIQISVNEMYDGDEILSNYELTELEQERYSRWDKLLNDIWAVLKNELDKNEMDKLTKIQNQWIKDKETTAKRNAKEFEGGTMENLTYVSSLAEITEQRCKELINIYMQ